MFSERKLSIIYPHHLRFMSRKAHEILIIKTCHALAKRGHSVHLLVGNCQKSTDQLLKYYGLEPCNNLFIHQLPIFRMEGKIRLSWNTVFHYYCRREIEKLKAKALPDLLYLSELKLALYLQKKNINIPMVYEIHGLYAKNYTYPNTREKTVFQGAKLLITTTEPLKTAIQTIYDYNSNIRKVPLATDINHEDPQFLLAQPGKICKILYIGDLYPLQGVDIAVRALAKLPDWYRLDVVGGRKEIYINSLRELAQRMKVEKRIRFIGFVSPCEVGTWMRNAHILIIPSLDQGKMPYVAHTKIYEYMAAGRPIVASDLPSIHEVLKDGENALLFPPNDSNKLAECLEKLAKDPALARKIAENAWSNARNFSWEARAQLLEKCFLELLKK